MEKENKYYIPSIEEFHHNFDYELNIKDNWNKLQFDCRHGFGPDIFDYLKENKIRVKYLDSQDIESCGWESEMILDENDELVQGYEISVDETQDAEKWYNLYILPDNKIKIIYKYYTSSVTQNWKVIFEGKLSNINELKKLMQQLQIERI